MKEYRIKNMVCARCIKSVSGIFSSTGALVREASLGVVKLEQELSEAQKQEVKQALADEGFVLLDDRKSKMVEEIKQVIIDLVHYASLDEMKENLSVYLSRRLLRDYNYLSQLFSSVENTTIEQFFILQKIEKVKEWIVYDEMTLGEMALKLNYSSVAHLSGQFRKVTGFTPTAFKKLKGHHRRHIDRI